MLLTQVVLHNVGVFLGRNEVDLSMASAERPVVLFGGLNGGGKTTFLESLQLGLYGKLAKTARRGSKAYEAYLESLINENVHPEEGACIELAFREQEDHEDREYRVVRTWRRVRTRITESVEVEVDGLLDQQLSQSWDEEVERFLPQRLCSLFFFDGEQIEALADPNQSSEILQTAISGLLGLELVDQLVTDLRVTKRNKLSERTNPQHRAKLDEIGRQVEALNDERNSLLARRGELVREVAQAQNELDRANSDYERQGGNLLDKLRELEAQKSHQKAVQSRIREEMRLLAAGAFPLRLVTKQLETLRAKASKELDGKLVSDALPILSTHDEQVIEWIECRASQPELSKELKEFLDQLRRQQEEKAHATTELDLPRTALYQLSNLLDDGLDQLAERAKRTSNELSKIEDNLADIERALVRVPDESALSEVIRRRERARLQYERVDAELQSTDGQLNALAASLAEEYRRSEEAEREARLAGLRDQLDERVISTADRIAGTMETFKAKVLERHLARLETLILESYKALLHKEGLVGSIRIDPEELKLTVLRSDGTPIEPGRLSAGERQLLATSVLWGLAKASGRALPVVIDTPLGRLDATHRRNLVENYFSNASHQVILLSTDEEITDRYYESLAPTISGEYEIYFDEERGGSGIRPGYPFEEAA